MYQFSEGTTIIHIHLEREGGLLFGKVTEIRAVEFLGEGAGRNLGNHESLGLFGECLKEFYNLTKCHVMGDGTIAIAANRFFAALRMTGRCRNDL